MAKPAPVLTRGSDIQTWKATTIRDQGRNEKFLEDQLASCPQLLGLETPGGVEGPFCSFQSIQLSTRLGRSVEADLILVSQSGHLVIVEVKLSDNAALRDRDVISQILDYKTALASISANELAPRLGRGEQDIAALFLALFPGLDDPHSVADAFLERLHAGQIHVVIASDRIPQALRDLAEDLRLGLTPGPELRIVEITPHVTASRPGEILLIPQLRLTSEVVQTIRVQVEYEGQRPDVRVDVDASPKQVADKVEGSNRRRWDESSFFSKAREHLSEPEFRAIEDLYKFTLSRGTGMTWGTGNTRGSFNPRFARVSERSPFTVYTDGAIQLNFGSLTDDDAAAQTRQQLQERASALFPKQLTGRNEYPSLSAEAWVPRAEEFKRVLEAVLPAGWPP